MVITIVTLVTSLLVGSIVAESSQTVTNDAVQFLIRTLTDDGFSEVPTHEIEHKDGQEERKKRAVDRCGRSYPTGGVNFMRCFSLGNSNFNGANYQRNYYRQGDYGSCLNYFNSLPLTNVARSANGVSGILNGPANRAFTVNTCQRCFGGNPGISVRGNDRPYNHLVRQFIFRINIYNDNPVVNRVGLPGNGGDGRYGIYNPCVGAGCGGITGFSGNGFDGFTGNGFNGNAGTGFGGYPDNRCVGAGCGGLTGFSGNGFDGFTGNGFNGNAGTGFGGYPDNRCVGARCGGLAGFSGNGFNGNVGTGFGGYPDNGCIGAGCGGLTAFSGNGCPTGTVC